MPCICIFLSGPKIENTGKNGAWKWTSAFPMTYNWEYLYVWGCCGLQLYIGQCCLSTSLVERTIHNYEQHCPRSSLNTYNLRILWKKHICLQIFKQTWRGGIEIWIIIEPAERCPVDWTWSQISIMYILMLNLFNVALYIDSISP